MLNGAGFLHPSLVCPAQFKKFYSSSYYASLQAAAVAAAANAANGGGAVEATEAAVDPMSSFADAEEEGESISQPVRVLEFEFRFGRKFKFSLLSSDDDDENRLRIVDDAATAAESASAAPPPPRRPGSGNRLDASIVKLRERQLLMKQEQACLTLCHR